MSNDLESSSTTDSANEQALVTAAERVNAALDVFIELLEDVQKAISGGRPKTLKVGLARRLWPSFRLLLPPQRRLRPG